MKDAIDNIIISFEKNYQSSTSISAVELLEIKYLGRKGKLNDLFIQLKLLSPSEKRKIGPKINTIKSDF